MEKLTVGSLFSGIGGFDLGLERAGFKIKWQVEIDKWCRQTLTKHWPEVLKYEDIRKCGGHNLAPVDLVCGGFPCQPFSVAGKRRGAEDDRHLWPEMLRVIKELKPRWVIGENVAGLANMGERHSQIKVAGKTIVCTKEGDSYSALWTHEERMYLNSICEDLEKAGYELAPPFVIPACALDAPHRRDRVWIVAYRDNDGRSGILRKVGQREEGPQLRTDFDGKGVGDGGVGPSCEEVLGNSICVGRKKGRADDREYDGSVASSDGKYPEVLADANKLYDDVGGHGTSPVLRTGQKPSHLLRSEKTIPHTTRKDDRGGHSESIDGQIQQSGVGDSEKTICDAPGKRLSQRTKEPMEGPEQIAELERSNRWPVEPSVGRVANGIPRRVDKLKGLGNAVVPQIPEIIGRMILEVERKL